MSSKEQELRYSICAQQELLRPYAGEQSLAVAQEFVDVETAKTPGWPGFNAMVTYLKAHPECRVLLVEKIDRLYRDFKDYVTIDDLDLKIHFVKEGFVLSKESRSSEKFMHGIKVLMAKNYIDNLREEVQKGLHNESRARVVSILRTDWVCKHTGYVRKACHRVRSGIRPHDHEVVYLVCWR